jgi:hypothetical protein
VRYNFLITRHVRDYLLLMLHVMQNESERPVFIGGVTGKTGRPGGGDIAAKAGEKS